MKRNSYIEQHHQVNANVNITEERAPTDESIRILAEMQEKTREKIVASLKLDNNLVSGVVYAFQDDVSVDKYICYIKFKLNGHEQQIRLEFDGNEFLGKEKDLLQRYFALKLAEGLAAYVFHDHEYSKWMRG